ncbi:MAG: DUF2855 family protein [Woeseiaceae bacterium]
MSDEFQIRRDNFETHRVVEADANDEFKDLADGQIRVSVERFAFTANNISYAAAGDQLGYWQFFPPAGSDADGWGMMPVWGFAEVIQSNVSDVPVGDRLFGYFPPASHLDITPTHISPLRLVDGAEHRAKLPQGYNTYYRVKAEPGYDMANDDLRMLLWPLHITSFCLWDVLQDNNWYGAMQIIIVSASSKTSIGLAYALDDDATAPPAVAITSKRNLDFVTGLGLYEQSLTYESLEAIDMTIPSVIVDMSGNGEVLGRLHSLLGDNMIRCINVGLTHWDEGLSGEGIIRERSEFFFAPTHIQRRMQDWGPDGFAERTSAFMQETALKSRGWLTLKKIDGLQGLADIYSDVCKGRVAADQGLIVEL